MLTADAWLYHFGEFGRMWRETGSTGTLIVIREYADRIGHCRSISLPSIPHENVAAAAAD